MGSLVDHDGGLQDYPDRPTNPQPIINPLPLRRPAIRQTLQAIESNSLFSMAGEFEDKGNVYGTVAALFIPGNPDVVTSQELLAHFAFPQTTTILDFISAHHSDTPEGYLFASALFGLFTFQHAARAQSANHNGRPFDIDPSLVPVFLRECAENMVEEETLGGYIEGRLEDMMMDTASISPDELDELRHLHPERNAQPVRYPMSRLGRRQRQSVVEKVGKWRDDIEQHGTDQEALATLILTMREYASFVIEIRQSELPEGEMEALKDAALDWVNIGFYFGHWMQHQQQETATFKERWS